jgi:hypothetical protein
MRPIGSEWRGVFSMPAFVSFNFLINICDHISGIHSSHVISHKKSCPWHRLSLAPLHNRSIHHFTAYKKSPLFNVTHPVVSQPDVVSAESMTHCFCACFRHSSCISPFSWICDDSDIRHAMPPFTPIALKGWPFILSMETNAVFSTSEIEEFAFL